MTDFLLELYSEEIPAGMQARGVSDLARLVKELARQVPELLLSLVEGL